MSVLSKGQGQPELELTEDERAITAYLSTGESLNAKILDIIVKPLWQQEPYRYLNRKRHNCLMNISKLLRKTYIPKIPLIKLR